MSLKNSVVLFLKGGPVKNGIALFAKHGNDPMFLRLCRMNPKANRVLLEKHLAKIAGITDQEFKAIKNEKEKKSTNACVDKTRSKPNSEKLPTSGGAEKKAGVQSNAQKLRDQYPFISSPECPPELHQLISLKITAYYNYVEGHKQLFDAHGLDDCLNKARYVVENYKENRLITAELDYYKKTKTVLGLHPLFSAYKKIVRLRNMNIVELVLKSRALKHNIWRIESNIAKNDKPHLLSQRSQALVAKKIELAELNRLLNINE